MLSKDIALLFSSLLNIVGSIYILKLQKDNYNLSLSSTYYKRLNKTLLKSQLVKITGETSD